MRTVFREDHEQFRDAVRRFVDNELVPYLHQWEHDGIVPQSVWRQAGAAGLLCCTVRWSPPPSWIRPTKS